MKLKNCTLYLLLIIPCVMLFTGCNDEPSKNDIITAVNQNCSTFVQCIENDNYDKCKTISIIKEIIDHNEFIEFYCGGSGLGGETSYKGFYYFDDGSIDNITNLLGNYIGNDNLTFAKSGSGYLWVEDNGDNSLYIEIITDHFVYFEQCF